MKKTLYLLRKPVEQIDAAVFLPQHSTGDVVLLDGSGGQAFPYAGGSVFALTEGESQHGLTYDGLIRKIFECDHTIVL